MNNWLNQFLLVAIGGSLLVGCASSHPPLVTDPVGSLGPSAVRSWGNPQGTLLVYTATESIEDGGLQYQVHTPYRVCQADGKLVKAVQNRVGFTDTNPLTVPLPAGTYYVHARVDGKGWVTVPVVILQNRLTVVNLEYTGLPEAENLPEAERVRLPDGRVIGRRAAASPTSP